MQIMKGRSVLAVAVCLVCFIIGYLTYLATTLFVDAVKSKVVSCLDLERGCGQRETDAKSR